MILDELTLQNVGTFAGKQSFTLTPPSLAKPIVLIGGLNGAGKTTVLEAIHLALYGPLAQPSGRRAGSYENYLRGLIHHGAPQSEGAVIDLRFHAHQEGAEHQYRVRRSWHSTGASVREILLVSVDGRHDQALTSTWSDHVETFLPRGIAGLFFFDGEQIEALADMERSREVLGSALAALLGLDLVERLTADLSVLRRRHRASQVPESLRESVEERQLTVTAVRQAEEAASDAIGSLRVELERSEKRLFQVSEKYRAAGGDLLEQREVAETTARLVRDEVVRAQMSLRDELADVAPLLQVAELIGSLADQAHRENQAESAAQLLKALESRDELVIERLGELRVPAAKASAISAFLAEDREQRSGQATIERVVLLKETHALDALVGSGLPAARRRLGALMDRQMALSADLDQADRVLGALPAPETVEPLRLERSSAAEDVSRVQTSVVRAEERLTLLRQERARADAAYEGALDKAALAGLAADDDRRMIEHVERVRATLEQLRLAATRKHLDRIGELILEALARLLRKDNLITGVSIDADTHAVELTGPGDRPLPAQQLSAGERQLLAVALLWGLARAAGQPLPVVIDTPLGRLDGSHREHLLDRYFPHASHQVILLSTDTEIDHEAYDRIARHVGRAYRLEFDDSTSSTSIQPGYFWE